VLVHLCRKKRFYSKAYSSSSKLGIDVPM
jgi:hypothetical protein